MDRDREREVVGRAGGRAEVEEPEVRVAAYGGEEGGGVRGEGGAVGAGVDGQGEEGGGAHWRPLWCRPRGRLCFSRWIFLSSGRGGERGGKKERAVPL